MNEFTELRQSLYQRHPKPADRDIALGESLLHPSLLDRPDIRLRLSARRLVHDPNAREISAVLDHSPSDPYVLRYLADALAGLASVDAAATLIRDSPVSDEIGLSLAGDAAIPAFQPDEVAEVLVGSDASALTAALGYVAAHPDPRYTPYLVDVIRQPNSSSVAVAAGIAMESVKNTVSGPESTAQTSFAGDTRPLVLQTVFYGDPTRPGRGGSGGIGTLVLRLGNAIAERGDSAATFIPAVSGSSGDAPDIQELTSGHVLYRFHVALGGAGPLEFLLHRPGISRGFRRALELSGLRPSVVHVRFLDDASLGIVRESKMMGIATAVTLAPDPHRRLVGPDGRIFLLDNPDDFLDLHRIWIGDEMARGCRGLMAIGKNTMRREVLAYFPEASRVKGRILASVDEGVPVIGGNPVKATSMPFQFFEPHRPVILCVGRLSPIKNFPAMVAAWADGLWRSHNLLIVGGDTETPSDEESRIIGEISRVFARAPAEGEGRGIHLSGQDPSVIQKIESWLAERRSLPTPDLYVAPSLKEEFGLAILEAMGAGMIACAPVWGGAGAYIRSGVNGFLIDTRDAHHLRRDIGRVITVLESRPRRSTAIGKAARETVRTGYSLDAMAEEYRIFYRSLYET